MPGSYTKINYSLRPAKAIERKMLCEAFRRLNEFATIDSYRYVGLGSTYFSDFTLFHRNLGISNMISIEKDDQNEERFRFNVPFNCIDIEFGETTDVLPRLSWDVRSIVWLDYDDPLDLKMLDDMQFLIGNITSGSIVIISCNAMVGDFSTKDKLDMLKTRLREKVPFDVKEEDLGGWKAAKVLRRIIDNEIQSVLSDRNAVRHANNKFMYKQLFNFNYQDGAKMLTVGGIIYEAGEKLKVEKILYEGLPFLREGDEPFKIDIPNLTYKELRYLDTQLPHENIDEIEQYGIPKRDIRKYAEFYRYFPNYMATES